MTDVLDKVAEREEQLLALRLAPHRDCALSDDEIDAIASSGRDCIDCGLPIPYARLRANPFAVRCIRCQQQHEDNQR